jgi:O-methyltransferase involved in polyketide biosynthesis
MGRRRAPELAQGRVPELIRSPLRRGPDAISPTAHYTGHVWARNGLSDPELRTFEGRLLFDVLAPAMAVSRALGGPTLEGLLLARHRIIDELLARAIDDGRVSQVLEIASGMSPRGRRFVERYGEGLTYVEADLPAMAARKRRALERIAPAAESHRVAEIDALRDDGPRSVAAVVSTLDPVRGLAIVTEGLLTYFDEEAALGMWRRFARELRRFSDGLYLTDLRLGGTEHAVVERAFVAVLSAFVQRRVHTHFSDEATAVDALLTAGFAEARLHRADRHAAAGDAGRDPAAGRIHIVEASTTSPSG